jgi:hypothetical protein
MFGIQRADIPSESRSFLLAYTITLLLMVDDDDVIDSAPSSEEESGFRTIVRISFSTNSRYTRIALERNLDR